MIESFYKDFAKLIWLWVMKTFVGLAQELSKQHVVDVCS